MARSADAPREPTANSPPRFPLLRTGRGSFLLGGPGSSKRNNLARVWAKRMSVRLSLWKEPAARGNCAHSLRLRGTKASILHLRTYAPTHLRTYAPTHLPTYPPTHLPTYPPTHIPTYPGARPARPIDFLRLASRACTRITSTSRGPNTRVQSAHKLRTWVPEGFDPSRFLILRGRVPRSVGNPPEN